MRQPSTRLTCVTCSKGPAFFFRCTLFFLLIGGSSFFGIGNATAQPVESALWQTDGQGNVTWDTTRLNDFTNVGYMNGNATIPTDIEWPTGVDVTQPPFNAIPDDDIDDSQAFIDAIAACPPNQAVFVPKGRYIMLQRISIDRDYVVLRGEDMYETVLFYPKNTEEIYIQEVGYQNPAYFSAGNGYRNTGGEPFIVMPGGTHRSIENLTIEFREQIKMGHWEHKGNDAIRHSGIHSWIKNIYIRNVDHGISTSGGQYITVRNIVFDDFVDRNKIAIEAEGSKVGHMAMHLNDTDDNLYHNILMVGDFSHEFDVKRTVGVVISDVKTKSNVVAYHGQGVKENLYTNLESGDTASKVGGDNPYNETYWGVYSSDGDLNTEDAQFAYDQAGQDHVYVGYDIDASIFPTKIDPDFWYEAIEPSQLSPLNIYLAQMAEVGKPVPDSPALQAPNPYTGDVIKIKGVENNYVSEASPTTVMDMGFNFAPADNTYIKFDLSQVNLTTIHRVRLRLAATIFQNTPVELGVSSITDDSWTEDSITHANRPLPLALLDSVQINEDTNAYVMEFDVTSFVQNEWANDPSKLVSFNVDRLSGNGFLSSICSITNGFGPILIIEQVPSAVAGAPSAPSDVRATSLIGNIQLDWPDNPESDVVTYNVYRSTTSGELKDYGFPIGMGLTTSDFVDVQHLHYQGWDIGMMHPHIPYFYRITAVDAHGYESESSLEIIASPKPWEDNSLPPSFTVSPVVLPRATQYIPYTDSLVGSATDPEGDTLYFAKASGPDWVQIAPDGTVTATPREGDTGTFSFTVLVSALNGGYDEATVVLSVDEAVPDAPQFVDLLPGDGSVQLDWVHDAEGSSSFTFNVYRAPDAMGPYSPIATGLTTSDLVDSGLTNGETAFYVVTASNLSGESPISSVMSATPIAGFSVGTTYLGGGNITDPAYWDNGLPVGQWGRIHVDASFDSAIDLDGYTILHSGGTLTPSGISGLKLINGSQWITEGDSATTAGSFRGFRVSSGSSFTLYNGTIQTSSSRDWVLSDTNSTIAIHGGTVNLGRDVELLGSAGTTFTMDGGTLNGNPGSGFIGANHLSNNTKTVNFNGGTAWVKVIDLSGDNTTFHLGGNTTGSLTVESITGFGTNSTINFLPGSFMTLSVTTIPNWAETEWNAGHLTYDGQGTATLGTWAAVTASNGLAPGVSFAFDSGTGALSLSQTVAPNQPPAFSSDPIVRSDALEAAAYSSSIAGDASDPESDPLTFSRLSGPAWLSVAANGSLSGTPLSSDAGLNVFQVQVSDGNGGSDIVALEVSVTNVNDAPVFGTDPVIGTAGTEDVAYDGSLYGTATDEDGDGLTYTITSGPGWLSVTPLGTLSGTPTNSDVGLNTFSIHVSDGNGGSDTATLEITVANQNDAPVFGSDPVAGAPATEEAAYNGTLAGTASDDDGDALSYTKLSGPGWLTVATNGSLSGTPLNSDVGLNSFSIEVSDGNGGTDTATLEITVRNVNDAPTFTTDPVIGVDATENSVYTESLAGAATDVDGDILSYSKLSGPAWLSVASDGDLYGVPGTGDLGLNSFSVGVSDGYGGSDTAVLQITVQAGVPPTVFTDADVTDNLISNPGNWSNGLPTGGVLGTIAINAKHDSGFTHDGYSIVHSDGTITKTGFGSLKLGTGSVWEMNGATAVLTSTRGLNLNASTFILNQGTATLTENTTDTTLNAVSELIVNGGTMDIGRSLIFNTGDLTLTGGVLDIGADMGARNFNGGGTAHLDGGTVTANLLTFGNTGFEIAFGGSAAGSLTVTNFGGSRADTNLIDIEFEPGSQMSMQLTNPVESGASGDGDLGWSKVGSETGLPWAEALWADGRLTYNGQDYTTLGSWATVTTTGMGDGYVFVYDAPTATLSLIYAPTNHDPVFTSDPVVGADADEDAPYTGSLVGTASDQDGDPLQYSKVSGPNWLSVASNGDLTGTPSQSDVGLNSFTVSVDDGNGGSDMATLEITVNNVNDAPVFGNDPIAGADATEDTAYSGSLAGEASDEDGDGLTYSKTTGPGWLNVAAGGALSGTPTNGDVGLNSFTVRVVDGNGGDDTATLNITVINVNDAPVFASDPFSAGNATEDAAYSDSIAGSATDDDGDSLSYSKTGGPAWLSVAANGALSGTPTSADLGLNSFTVSVSDGNGGSDTAELQITVDSSGPPSSEVVVGLYTFGGTNRYASTDSDIDSVASDMVVGAGVTSFHWETRSFWSPTQPSAAFDAGLDFADGTVLDDDYFAFTITPQSGNTLALSSLSFIDRSGGFSVSVASSQDGFATVIDSAVAAGGWSTTTLDLSSLSATAGAVELRLYFHDGAGSNRMIDNVDIQGVYASASVPEVNTETAGNITLDSADVGFTVVDEGGETPTVFLFHGESDGGTTPANWDNSQNLGALTAGSYAVTLNSLSEGTLYYYSVQAFNSAGLDWGSTRSFTTDVDTSPKLVQSVVSGVTTDGWQTFDLGQTYTSAVIVAMPILPDSSHPPVVTRIQNVSGSTFDLMIQRIDGLTGSLTLDVSVVAVEEGVYTQATDGVTLEAVKMTSTVTARKSNWANESRTYQNTYTSPVVVGQVMSANDPLWSAFWCQGSSRSAAPSASTLRVGKHVGEDPINTRADETLGYIVIESGNGTINGVAYTAGVGGDDVQGVDNTSTGYTYTLTGLTSASAAAATLAGMDGGDGGFAVLYGPTALTATGLTLVVDEDQLGDGERSHTREDIGYLVFE